jgi:AraC family transcriptional regulator
MHPRATYIARINRVIDHIDAHLADALDLDTLAAVAHFSPWHFHRVFHAMTGETLADCVRRRRLETAAARLLALPPTPGLGIALDVGFGSAEAFTRSFRAYFGVTPTAWRRGAYRDWAERHRVQLSKIHQADRKRDQAVAQGFRDDRRNWPAGSVVPFEGDPMNVDIQTLAATRVAYMRCVGPYGTSAIPQTWQRFAVWCEQQGFTQPRRPMYGVAQDNPEITSPEKCRYDACVLVDASFEPAGEIGVQTLAGGRYACVPFAGTPADIHAAWSRLYGQWLPDSGYQADDRPCIELYDVDFVMDEKTGAFNCRLCMPVRPL